MGENRRITVKIQISGSADEVSLWDAYELPDLSEAAEETVYIRAKSLLRGALATARTARTHASLPADRAGQK